MGLSHWQRKISEGWSRIRCWGRYLGLRRTRKQGNGEDCITGSFMVCTVHRILLVWTNHLEGCGAYGKGSAYCVLVGKPEKKRDLLGDLIVDGKIILKSIFKKYDGSWTGFIWLRIRASGWLLWTFGFHRTREVTFQNEQLSGFF